MDYSQINLGVALPNTNSHFNAQFVNSFFCMRIPFKVMYLTPFATMPIDTVRNELAQMAIANGCTHIWYCDTDQVYPQETLVKMLEHDLDIVVAKVHMRKPPYGPMLRREDENGKFYDIPDEEWEKGGLVEVDGTGFGCVLLKTEVLIALERPWFKLKIHENPPIGEDFYFWAKAKKAGFRIFVDCDIKIGHLHTFCVDESTYFGYKYTQVWDRNESSEKAVGAPGPPSQKQLADSLKKG